MKNRFATIEHKIGSTAGGKCGAQATADTVTQGLACNNDPAIAFTHRDRLQIVLALVVGNQHSQAIVELIVQRATRIQTRHKNSVASRSVPI